MTSCSSVGESSEDVLGVEDTGDVEGTSEGWGLDLSSQSFFNLGLELFELGLTMDLIERIPNIVAHDRSVRGRTPEAIMDHTKVVATCIDKTFAHQLEVGCVKRVNKVRRYGGRHLGTLECW